MTKKTKLLQVRISEEELKKLQSASKKFYFDTVSEFVRYLVRQYIVKEQ